MKISPSLIIEAYRVSGVEPTSRVYFRSPKEEDGAPRACALGSLSLYLSGRSYEEVIELFKFGGHMDEVRRVISDNLPVDEDYLRCFVAGFDRIDCSKYIGDFSVIEGYHDGRRVRAAVDQWVREKGEKDSHKELVLT